MAVIMHRNARVVRISMVRNCARAECQNMDRRKVRSKHTRILFSCTLTSLFPGARLKKALQRINRKGDLTLSRSTAHCETKSVAVRLAFHKISERLGHASTAAAGLTSTHLSSANLIAGGSLQVT